MSWKKCRSWVTDYRFAADAAVLAPVCVSVRHWLSVSVVASRILCWLATLGVVYALPPRACLAAEPPASMNDSMPMHAAAEPLNYFLHGAGPASLPVRDLDWALTALCVAVCVVIACLLVAALWHRRRQRGNNSSDGPNSQHDLLQGGRGMLLIGIGGGISTVALLAALIYASWTLQAVAHPPHRAGLTITVTAYDWWWRVDYAQDRGADGTVLSAITTANEIHIPTGVAVEVRLKSADVIHAFWVPMLAGKTQMIPGQTNEQWLQADKPGVYRGQCTQYCGAQHAHMAFEVVADRPAVYEAWRRAQQRDAAPPASESERHGQSVFLAQCAACHTMRGTAAHGVQGPDLTHIASRGWLAAGTLTNTPDHLRDWFEHAQAIKPEALMPNIALSPRDAADLSAYLARQH